MSQFQQPDPDHTQHPQSSVPLPGKDNSQIQQGFPSQTSNTFPQENVQPATSPRPSRFQQAVDDFISDVNALRKLRPTTNTSQNVRPFSITLAAIVTVVYACLCLLLALALLFSLSFLDLVNSPLSFIISFMTSGAQGSAIVVLLQDLVIAAIFYCSFLGVAHLYVARGLWQCKYGAYWGLIGLEILSILVQFFLLIFLHSGGFFFMSVYIPLLMVAFATYGFQGGSLRMPRIVRSGR